MCLLGRSFTSKPGTMQKVDLELDMHDDNGRQMVMRTVASLSGIKTIDTDMEHRLTVIGKVDPVKVANKLRKSCRDAKMGNSSSAEKDKDYNFYRTPVYYKKVVLKLEDMHDNTVRRKVMRCVTRQSGIKSIDTDMEDKKLTVVGNVDPVQLVNMLRNSGWRTALVTSGAAEEEKKKAEPKKEETKTQEDKNYNPYMTPAFYVVRADENPNSCVIC